MKLKFVFATLALAALVSAVLGSTTWKPASGGGTTWGQRRNWESFSSTWQPASGGDTTFGPRRRRELFTSTWQPASGDGTTWGPRRRREASASDGGTTSTVRPTVETKSGMCAMEQCFESDCPTPASLQPFGRYKVNCKPGWCKTTVLVSYVKERKLYKTNGKSGGACRCHKGGSVTCKHN